MSKHTPGPLECPGLDGGKWIVCTHKDKGRRRTLAHVYSEANARLYAAAPEMYEALKGIDFEVDCVNPSRRRAIESALAKAEMKGEGND